MSDLLTSIEQFGEQTVEEEKFCRLANARVMFANYEIIVRDFAPRFGQPGDPIGDRKRDAIDAFLIEHCAVISIPQVKHTVVNTPIPIKRGRTIGWRPPYYGRAAVMPVDDPPRLVDIKGCGVQPGEIPAKEGHSTGLLPASDAIHEFLFERLCKAAFQHAGSSFDVLPNYAVIDLGFDAIAWRNRRRERATILARRAHTRPRTLWDDDTPPGDAVVRLTREIALLLGRYGIASHSGNYRLERRGDEMLLRASTGETVFQGEEAKRVIAATHYREGVLRIDAINYQCTAGRPQLFDFGSFESRPEFTMPIFIATSAAETDLVGEFVHPDDPRYPRADVLRVPKCANLLATRWAGQYVRGEIDGPSIAVEIERFVRRCFRPISSAAPAILPARAGEIAGATL